MGGSWLGRACRRLIDHEGRQADISRQFSKKRSFALEADIANDSPIVLVLFAENSSEIGPTLSASKETERREFLLDLRRLHCGGKPANQLGYHLSWRPGGATTPPKNSTAKSL